MLATRRALLGNAALLGLGAALPRAALARPLPASRFPNVTGFVDGYVSSRKVPGMLAALGFGREDPTIIARGGPSGRSSVTGGCGG